MTIKALGALCALSTALLCQPALADARVGVTVAVNQPGFYGRVEIGNRQPRVIYQQPVVIQHSPVTVVRSPIYLRVPPQHHHRWARYCGYYRACGQPVYFVDEPLVRPYWAGRKPPRWVHEDRRGGRYEHHHRGHDHEHGDDDRRADDHGPARGGRYR